MSTLRLIKPTAWRCAIVGAAIFGSVLVARPSMAGCGNGVLEGSEECDPGGSLFINGDPDSSSCTNNGDCFYEFSCCKFNCQFVGQGASCADGNPCTTNDVCNNVGGCNSGGNLPTGTACNDGLYCTLADSCNASGTCQGSGNPCSGGTECADHCDEALDSCNDPIGTACGSPANDDCTDPDTCDGAGSCGANHAIAGATASTKCVDGSECTADVCNGSGGCANTPYSAGTACGDPTNSSCANPDTCDGAGNCLGNDELLGAPCGDLTDDDCRNPDSCDGAGACIGGDEPLGTPCGSGVDNDCTDPDACDGGGACVANHAPAGTLASATCDDQNECTADECDGAGACANPNLSLGTPCGDSTADDCTAPDSCSAGFCLANHAPDGQSCDDDNECTSDGSCTGGACVAADEVTCDDGQPCTYDHCDSLSGQCVFDDEPRPDCLPTLDAQIKVANRENDLTDKLKWLWKRTPDLLPEGLPPEGLGDPISVTEYTLCVFDGRGGDSTLVAQLDVPAGLFWQEKRPGFFKYKDKTRMSDGLFRGALRAGVKGAVGFAAGGVGLPLPTAASGTSYFEMMPSLTTQLSNNEGACWIADFTSAKVNRGDTFKTTRKAVVIPH